MILKIRGILISILGEKLALKIFKLRRKNYIYLFLWKVNILIYYFYLVLLLILKKKVYLLDKYKVFRINADDSFYSRVNDDLKIKKFFFSTFKHKMKYLIYNFPKKHLTDTDYAWGFDKNFYIDFLEENLGSEIRKIYNGLNYRVENIELWRDYRFGSKSTNNYHIDGDMPGMCKIIIYLSDVDINSGPLSIKDGDGKENLMIGPRGTAIIFNSRNYYHCGKPLNGKERIVITYVVYPTLRKKIYYIRNKPMDCLNSLNPFTKYS
tara:strand:+ start:335 stop:1129 length:795 start_codon:yes stop_codon:yes gene_type:complete